MGNGLQGASGGLADLICVVIRRLIFELCWMVHARYEYLGIENGIGELEMEMEIQGITRGLDEDGRIWNGGRHMR